MGKETFSVGEITAKIGVLQGRIEEFTKTIQEMNDLVEDLVQVNENSAVFGEFGDNLKKLWNANKSEVNEFVANFELWKETVTVISATNNNFAVDAANIYSNNSGTLTGQALANGTLSAQQRLASSSFNSWHSYEEAAQAGFSNIRTSREFSRGGQDKEVYGTYDNYLKAMYDKYN